ncbi:MAG: deoxyribonuclease V [Betaproteobacteria bacterium]|nr:deoxyribonuclease V [Betaproteobacteria bacterium]
MPWILDQPRSVQEAQAIQERLREQVVREDRLGTVRHLCGLDIGLLKANTVARAAAAVFTFPDLQPVECAIACTPVTFPYVPGLLSFREAPAALAALAKLARKPDLLLYDGQGLAHPRRFGIACHVGLAADIPAIGVAKTRLIGTHAEPPDTRGAWTPLLDGDETIGAVLRTRPGTQPIYVSIGHRISLDTAVRYVMACVTRYRLPETTRWSHRLASGQGEAAAAGCTDDSDGAAATREPRAEP